MSEFILIPSVLKRFSMRNILTTEYFFTWRVRCVEAYTDRISWLSPFVFCSSWSHSARSKISGSKYKCCFTQHVLYFCTDGNLRSCRIFLLSIILAMSSRGLFQPITFNDHNISSCIWIYSIGDLKKSPVRILFQTIFDLLEKFRIVMIYLPIE